MRTASSKEYWQQDDYVAWDRGRAARKGVRTPQQFQTSAEEMMGGVTTEYRPRVTAERRLNAKGAGTTGTAKRRPRLRDDGLEAYSKAVRRLRKALHRRAVTTGQLFTMMDRDRGNNISFHEFTKGVAMSGVRPIPHESLMRALFQSFDVNGNGSLHHHEATDPIHPSFLPTVFSAA